MKSEILDVTLRDGSYEVDFKFTSEDVKQVGVAVENSGIKYIEIGHGQGLNASSPQHGIASCTDEEYLSAAQENLTNIKYGMFCIPGIAKLKDLDILKKHGASFVRIGTNTMLSDVKNAQPYIEYAKQLGLTVFINFMKTYVATPKEFEKCVYLSDQFGTDYLVIVDSAGCMFPNDIEMYYNIIKSTCNRDVRIGFHGHDNLGLAVSNSLFALSIGCDIIDSSLQSLGRGAGNASTEQLLAIFQKTHKTNKYNLSPLMKFSEEYLRPKVKFKGVSGLDTYCGIAGFHSGYMPSIRKMAQKYNVSHYDLIIEYCKRDQINLDEQILDEIAKQLKRDSYEK